MKAMMLASQTIRLGINDVAVAGGMESMSSALKYLVEARAPCPSKVVSKVQTWVMGSLLAGAMCLFIAPNTALNKLDGSLKNGSRIGHDTIVDGMLKDGSWDVYNDFGMGDAYAIRSFERGIAAQNNGLLAWEIVPVWLKPIYMLL
ncbi:T28K15.11 protein, putative isoform 1 [Hibiscus syriacus]|uniref:T28K15.11 protein, putative isoform 1 n=1 Tax=Hibiscus syriacus TaxID=106335 RepID=A0A6A3AWI3_HIBSY|nr:T28K15.11 protein, putative isoform 1 [Hibiscus syriacus]